MRDVPGVRSETPVAARVSDAALDWFHLHGTGRLNGLPASFITAAVGISCTASFQYRSHE